MYKYFGKNVFKWLLNIYKILNFIHSEINKNQNYAKYYFLPIRCKKNQNALLQSL